MTDSIPAAEPIEPVATARSEVAAREPLTTPTDAGGDRIDTAQLLQVGRVEAEPEAEAESRSLTESYATISAVLGVIGVIGGLFVVWAAPFAVGAIVFAELTRRHAERNLRSRIGLITGIIGVVFAGVWALYYSMLMAS